MQAERKSILSAAMILKLSKRVRDSLVVTGCIGRQKLHIPPYMKLGGDCGEAERHSGTIPNTIGA